MKFRWWAAGLWIAVHALAAILIWRGATYKEPIQLIVGLILFMSPNELYPELWRQEP